MKKALADIFSSKKALAAIAGTIASALVLLASKYGYALDPGASQTLIHGILGLAGVYILGQGAADWGKERAKIEIIAATLLGSAEKLPEASAPKILNEEA